MRAIHSTSLRDIFAKWREPADRKTAALADVPFATVWYSGCLEAQDLPLADSHALNVQESLRAPVIVVGPSLQGPFKLISGSRRLVLLDHQGSLTGTRIIVGVHPDISVRVLRSAG
jgi:hypothetical protein